MRGLRLNKPMIMLDFRRRKWRMMKDGKFIGDGYDSKALAKRMLKLELEKALARYEKDCKRLVKKKTGSL
jgi:hypothetical protein